MLNLSVEAIQNENISLMSFPNWFLELSGVNPKVLWMNFRIETSSICVCEIKPFFANGEITSMGTRAPSPWASTCGGGTWSHQPPLESQMTTMAACCQMVDAW